MIRTIDIQWYEIYNRSTRRELICRDSLMSTWMDILLFLEKISELSPTQMLPH